MEHGYKTLNIVLLSSILFSVLLLSSKIKVPDPVVEPHYYYIEKQVVDTVYVNHGFASWYGPGFHGRKTANGETYSQDSLTAASPSLPFGTKVRVTNLKTQQCVDVVVNDRGPYDCEVVDNKVLPLYPLRPHPSRVLDLSREAMVQIGGYADGVVPISYIISDD